jgi:hypothetical protein
MYHCHARVGQNSNVPGSIHVQQPSSALEELLILAASVMTEDAAPARLTQKPWTIMQMEPARNFACSHVIYNARYATVPQTQHSMQVYFFERICAKRCCQATSQTPASQKLTM